jgi:hemolysin activation/secretion protein
MKSIARGSLLLSSLGGFIPAADALAQPALPPADRNRDRFPQPRPEIAPLPSQSPDLTAPTPIAPAPAPTQVLIPIRRIEVIGNTILPQTEIDLITSPLQNRQVTFGELQAAVDRLTQGYLDRGYITSRAVLMPQDIIDGAVKIQAIEGTIEQIEVVGLQRLDRDYVVNRINIDKSKPFDRAILEAKLQLLGSDPLFERVSANLRSGTAVGKSIVTINLREHPAIYGAIGSDNNAPPSIGAERVGGTIGYRNPSGKGDDLNISYYRNLSGSSNSFDFNYSLPLNSDNGTLKLRFAPSDSKIIAPEFAAFNLRNTTNFYELSYRQPFLRQPTAEFALSLGLAVQDGRSFIFDNTPTPFGVGASQDGTTKTRTLKFGQDYIARDRTGGWGLRSQFNLGLGIFDGTINTAPVPDSRYFNWTGQAQRVEKLGADNLAIAQLEVQLSPNSILPSQQFVLGGSQSIRGYRQNARAGDNGIRLSIEDRIVLSRNSSGAPTLQIAPFLEGGGIWNHPTNPNRLTGNTWLLGTGAGIIYEPLPKLQLRLDYGIPLVNPGDRGRDLQDAGVYFNIGYGF